MTRADIIKSLGHVLTVSHTDQEAVDEAIKIILDSEWIEPEIELPPSLDFVLALITGRVNNIRCEHAPFVASYAPEDGWMLVHATDRKEDSWKVDAWMPIPDYGEDHDGKEEVP